MMTREEAVERLKRLKRSCRDLAASMPEEPGWALHGMALDMAISALRPVSREQVERVWRGCKECHNQANWPSWIEKGFVYCPKCGTPLASWAWEKQMERLEALKDE